MVPPAMSAARLAARASPAAVQCGSNLIPIRSRRRLYMGLLSYVSPSLNDVPVSSTMSTTSESYFSNGGKVGFQSISHML